MPSQNKIVPIKYTSRDFSSIKKDLVNYSKRYYPNTFRDFNEASFGSLMLDTVSYVGDILSFYLDYQANESFLDTAIEYDNIVKHGRQLGYNLGGAPTAFGTVALYIIAPATNVLDGPDPNLLPILKKGSALSSLDGQRYILNQSVDFSATDNEIVVAQVDPTTGAPTSYAVRTFGQIISGEFVETRIDIGDYRRFNRIEVPDVNISEIISVFDAEGHQYYQVDNLSQNVVFVETQNKGANTDTVNSLMRPIIVARRFVVEYDRGKTTMVFGFGSEENLKTNMVTDPSDVILDIHGKNYASDTSFDPSKLTKVDKFGIAPANTTLRVVYRKNSSNSVNAATETITKVSDPNFIFPALERGMSISEASLASVITSLEVTNLSPIVGETLLPSADELKIRIFGNFATQNRAVTHQDYESICYRMPPQFGSIKRVRATQDSNSFKRNLNMYIISEDSNGKLIASNSSIKNNLKQWIGRYKMINDTIDILDAYILNLQIDFTAISNRNANRFDVLDAANAYLRSYVLNRTYEIGERFYISDIYQVLKAVPGLLDVTDVTVRQRAGADYSSIPFNVEDRVDPDGRYIDVPKNVIVEIKFPNSDIRGTIK